MFPLIIFRRFSNSIGVNSTPWITRSWRAKVDLPLHAVPRSMHLIDLLGDLDGLESFVESFGVPLLLLLPISRDSNATGKKITQRNSIPTVKEPLGICLVELISN